MGLGVRELGNKEGARCSEPSPWGLCPILFPLKIMSEFVCQGCNASPGQVSRSLRDLAKTVLRDSGQNCFLSP